VVLDEISDDKNVYIFRSNSELLISYNGRVDKAKWEYLGNNSLLIDEKEESYLFRHGFLDENVLALKVDSKNEYAFLVNENMYDTQLNSIKRIADFLSRKYLEPINTNGSKNRVGISSPKKLQNEESQNTLVLLTDKGRLDIRTNLNAGYTKNDIVFLDGVLAPDGKYVYGWPSWISYIVLKDGRIKEL
jgi:hypothetical protein